MKTLLSTAVALLMVPSLGFAAEANNPAQASGVQLALMCIKSGEQISGLNKICYYNCAGSDAAITVKSYQLCPLSINR